MVQWNGSEYECYVGNKKFKLTEEELWDLLEDNGITDDYKAEIEDLNTDIELLEERIRDLEAEIEDLNT